MYKPSNLCSAKNPVNCLYEAKYFAIRSDGRKVNVKGMYGYRGEGDTKDRFHPHFLTGYLKDLRSLYESDISYAGQLFDQVGYMVSKAVERYGALVWESRSGYTHAMEQGEYAYLFASIAQTFKLHNDLHNAKIMMTYALKFARAFNRKVGFHTGGVLSDTFYCGAKKARSRPAYWFHSLGVNLKGKTRTVLNKHLHAIRDLLYIYSIVRKNEELIHRQFGSPQKVLYFLEDKAIGGLYQLAFSGGHKGIAPKRPPNIRQFMNRKIAKVKPTAKHPDGNPLPYYWAFYDFDMASGKAGNIKPDNTCHYHTHVLNLVENIKTFIDDNTYFKDTQHGWRLYEAMDALLQGRGEPTGILNSKNAIYQFYRSESPTYKIRRENCSPGPDDVLSPDAVKFYKRLFD